MSPRSHENKNRESLESELCLRSYEGLKLNDLKVIKFTSGRDLIVIIRKLEGFSTKFLGV
jgi:hypothetical protein